MVSEANEKWKNGLNKTPSIIILYFLNMKILSCFTKLQTVKNPPYALPYYVAISLITSLTYILVIHSYIPCYKLLELVRQIGSNFYSY